MIWWFRGKAYIWMGKGFRKAYNLKIAGKVYHAFRKLGGSREKIG